MVNGESNVNQMQIKCKSNANGESNANLSRNIPGKYSSKFPTPADVVYYFERLVWSIKIKFKFNKSIVKIGRLLNFKCFICKKLRH